MKVTNRLTHIATKVNFEAAMTEDQLKAVFESEGTWRVPRYARHQGAYGRARANVVPR